MSSLIETRPLQNGLRVAVIPVEGTSFVELVLAVRVGSRYEPIAQAGISHLLEHLIFRGSQKFPSSYLLNRALETLGDGLEGGTAREYSMFAMSVTPEHLSEVLVILADLFGNPLLQELETEKGIVMEEMLEELDENGEECDSFNISRKLLFGEHPMARPVLGREKSLAKIKRPDLLAHFKKFYRPDQMVLVASGKVDSGFFAEAKKSFGKLASTGGGAKAEFEEDRVRPGKSGVLSKPGPAIHYLDKPSSQIEVTLSFATKGERSASYIPALALQRVLDDGLASRLQRNLCERKGLLYDIDVCLEGYSDLGVMDITFRMAKSKAIEAMREVFHELEQLKTVPLDSEELYRIQSRMHRDVIGLFESPRAIGQRAGESLLLDLKTPLSLVQWTDAIRALDADILMRVAADLFVPERMAVILEGKLSKKDQAEIDALVRGSEIRKRTGS